MIPYGFHGHTVFLFPEQGRVSGGTCAVPRVIEKAIVFMHENNVSKLTVDGVELRKGSA